MDLSHAGRRGRSARASSAAVYLQSALPDSPAQEILTSRKHLIFALNLFSLFVQIHPPPKKYRFQNAYGYPQRQVVCRILTDSNGTPDGLMLLLLLRKK